MFKQFKHFTLQMVAGANVVTIIVMLLIGYSDRLQPQTFPLLANIGLTYPLFLLFNLGFLVFWLLFKTRWAMIPILGFLVSYGPVRQYMPLNVSTDVPKGAIKVLSYNVWLFAGWDDTEGQPNPILEYIVQQNADIVCLQEATADGIPQRQVDSTLHRLYAYSDTLCQGAIANSIAIYSKYPIIGRERIAYPSRGNLSAAFRLKINGDTVLVINNHFETTGLSSAEKTRFKNLIKGHFDTDTAKQTSKLLITKLGEASVKRAPQAEAVARYLRHHSGMSTIVCGDFNDGPISYTHRTVAHGLTDCYVATGNGPGISYHTNGFFVRIDNILCSADWQPYGCKVDSKIKASDHYPIICWLKKR